MSKGCERLVLAYYSPVRAWLAVFGNTAMIGALYFLTFYTKSGDPTEYIRSRSRWAVFIVIALVGSIWLAWQVLGVVRQLLLDSSAAIWICHRQLFYQSGRKRVPVDDIVEVNADTYKYLLISHAAIALKKRDQTTELILSDTLSEPTGVIVERIRAQLVKFWHS